jgi:cellulose synthase/poly-beta-1,6-N-acetylglucosamine synthase-like glycosyltransferase
MPLAVSVLLLLSALLLPFWLLTLVKAVRAVRRRTDDWVTADDVVQPSPDAVSILIAARNEELTIGACLESLRAQTHPSFEVIVVDDRSEDETSRVVRAHAEVDPRIIPMRADSLPEGWYGKPHALHLAAQRAKGAWLLLTYADTFHRETSVANGLAFAKRKGVDAASVVGEMIHPSIVSSLVTPQLYALLAASIERKKRSDPQSIWTACGGWFLIRREAFDRAGGMERVKSAISEDLALARELAKIGAKYAFGIGAPALWRTTSYATLGEIHRGYARNENLRMDGAAKAIGLTLLIWLLALTPIATFLGALMTWDRLPPSWAVFGVVQYGCVLLVQGFVRKVSRARWWLAPLAPLGALLAWMMMMSWSFGRRSIEWKGRTYAA